MLVTCVLSVICQKCFVSDLFNDMACHPGCQGARGPVNEVVRAPGGLSGRLSRRRGGCLGGFQCSRGLPGRLSGHHGACLEGFQRARGPVWEAARATCGVRHFRSSALAEPRLQFVL